MYLVKYIPEINYEDEQKHLCNFQLQIKGWNGGNYQN